MYHNAIIDFINTETTLLQKDQFFHLFKAEQDERTVYIVGDANKVSFIVDTKDRSAIVFRVEGSKWIARDTVNGKDIVVVDGTRSEAHPNIWFDSDAVNVSYRAFPDHVFEHCGKLFYWYDNKEDRCPKPEIINKLYQYHYVDTLISFMYWPDVSIDDGKTVVSYTFPREDMRQYKKRKSH